MMKIANSRSGLVRRLALAATAALMLAALPGKPAQAMSLINAATAPSAGRASEGFTTEVHFGGHGGGGFHGGGGGFHGGGGGWHGGGGFHAAPVFHGGGGGWHGGGFHDGGYGFHHVHRRFFGGGYYPYYGDYYPYYYGGYYPYHRCRIVWTYHGPRRVCHWPHHWHRWHHHHWYHRHYW